MFFEDYTVGEIIRFGRHEVTREEVLAFARAYDPQPFHLDDEAAAANPIFGRIAASGWHVAAMAMRMTVDHWQKLGPSGSLGGAGIEDLRWIRPVYPGDVLRVEVGPIETRPSASKPDRGIVRFSTTVFNQHDEPVMRQTGTGFFRRRDADPSNPS